MTKYTPTLALVFAVALASTVRAQTPDKAPAAAANARPANPTIPLKVQIVISRYQGEKKVSSLPYTLSVTALSGSGFTRASLRMGAQVPVMMVAAPVVGGEKMPTAGPIQYKDVGTNIDCDATVLDDGRFRLAITVDDSSVYPDEHPKDLATSGSPSFRSFRATDSMVLKDGGTAQFTAATDKVNGDIVKVDITLTVVK
jgi:hypothetical protein